MSGDSVSLKHAALCGAVLATLILAKLAQAEPQPLRLRSLSTLDADTLIPADLNGDGRVDLIATSTESTVLEWYSTTPGFPPTWSLRGDNGSSGRGVGVADFDGDGDLDIHQLTLSGVPIWLVNEGGDSPQFDVVRGLLPGGGFGGQSIGTGFIDDNPILDVVTTIARETVFKDPKTGDIFIDYETDIVWASGNGAPDGSFGSPVTIDSIPGDGEYDFVWCADINGDGRADILHLTPTSLGIYFNSDTDPPVWTAYTSVPYEFRSPFPFSWRPTLHTTDIDGDQDNDILLINAGAQPVIWLENDGAALAGFSVHALVESYGAGGSSASAGAFPWDIDGDNDIDLVCTLSNGGVFWLDNQLTENGAFLQRSLATGSTWGSAAAAADFDNDGDADLAIAGSILDWFEQEEVLNLESGKTYPTIQGAIDDAQNGDTLEAGASVFMVEQAVDFAGKPLTIRSREEIKCPESAQYRLTDGARIEAAAGEDVELSSDTSLTQRSQAVIAGARIVLPPAGSIMVGPGSTLEISSDLPSRLDGRISVGDGAKLLVRNPSGFGEAISFEKQTLRESEIGFNAVDLIDFDLDGDLDIVAASRYEPALSWFENLNGSQSEFLEHPITSEGLSVQEVIAVDLDGDEVPELAAIDFTTQDLVWIRRSSTDPGQFDIQTIQSAIDDPAQLKAVDLDRDRDLDLIATSFNDGEVVWYENTGTQQRGTSISFVERSISGAIHAQSLDAGDLNRDGRIDIVSASPASQEPFGQVAAHIRAPGQGFAFLDRAVTGRGIGVDSVHLGDMDSDGDLDILSASQELAWHENDGLDDPTFTTSVISAGSRGFDTVRGADIDGDGDLDAIAASTSNNEVVLFENDGAQNPGFTTSIISGTVSGAGDFEVADIDSDGDLDIVVAGRASSSVTLLEQLGRAEIAFSAGSTLELLGTLTNESRLTLGSSMIEVNPGGFTDWSLVNAAPGVISGQGVISADVLNTGVISPGADDTAGTIEIHGDFSLVPGDPSEDAPEQAGEIRVGLVRGEQTTEADRLEVAGTARLDGPLIVTVADDVTLSPGDRFTVLTSASLLGTSFSVAYMPGLPDNLYLRVEYQRAGVGDLRASESVDLVVAELSDLIDFGSTNFDVGGDATAVVAGDFDNINGDDLAVAFPGLSPSDPGSVIVLLNGGVDAGSGVWQNFTGGATQTPTGAEPAALAVGFFDSDALLDLAVANSGDDTVTILLNDGLGDGSFNEASGSPIAVGGEPVSLAVADLNRDGDDDLAVANHRDDTVSVLINNGNASFFPGFGSPHLVPASPTWVAAADIDGVNGADLAVTSGATHRVTLLFNDDFFAGNFSDTATVFLDDQQDIVCPEDVDNDKDPDLVIANRNSDVITIVVYDRDGLACPADLNGDGVVNTADEGIVLGDLGCSGSCIGDINGDGVTDFFDLTIIQFFFGPCPYFLPPVDLDVGARAVSLAVVDLDGDGDSDIAFVTDDPMPAIRILRNDYDSSTGQLQFAAPMDFLTGSDPTFVLAAEIDGDGSPDLITVNAGQPTTLNRRGIAPQRGSVLFNLSRSLCPDLTDDGIVDSDDLETLIDGFGGPGPVGDLNADGRVDTADLGALIQAFGTKCG